MGGGVGFMWREILGKQRMELALEVVEAVARTRCRDEGLIDLLES